MLYIFQVETGSMMTFDMNLALQSVANLKKAISSQCHIPEDRQVLLISGGEYLNLSARVCSYSCSGTDTSPIFLFSKDSIDSQNPPKCVTDYDPDVDMSDRVQSCIDMNPNYNTVVARAEMAKQLHEMANQQLHNCERLVHDQHLQQQGWAAVVANLEDIAKTFSASAGELEDVFKEFVEDKAFYMDLLHNFSKDLDTLGRIPMLTSLLAKERHNSEANKDGDCMTLLEWISQKDNQNSLEQMSENCIRGLTQLDNEELKKIKEEVAEVMDQCNQSSMKEVKGLEERLYGLEKLMCEARKVVEEQRDLDQAFHQNQNRASHLRDPSILPDLCASHQQQLQVMLKNHQKLRDLRRRCARAKEELSGNLHARLRWIVFVERKLSDVNDRVLIYQQNIKRLKKHLEVVHQIHLAPKIYLAAVVEVVRRRTFSSKFLHWANGLAQQSSTLVESEIQNRQTFAAQLDSHFLQIVFPGMNDIPPRFANESPVPFDTKLPELSESDVEYLREKLPDLSELLSVPSPVPMPDSSDTRFKTSGSDAEEFETVNNESPGHQTGSKQMSTSDNFKDVFTEMSITGLDYKEIESNLRNMTTELEEKAKQFAELENNCDQMQTRLNSRNNSFRTLTKVSFDCLSVLKDFRNTFDTQFHGIKSDYLSSFESLKQQLIEWILLKDKEINERENICNKSIDEYKNIITQIEASKQELNSEISSLKDVVQTLTQTNETSNKELLETKDELNRVKEDCSETIKKLSLEHELELTSLNDEMTQLNSLKQSLEETVAQKVRDLQDMKNNFDKQESDFYMKSQMEKDVLKQTLTTDFDIKQQSLISEFEDKIKRLETNNEISLNELRKQLENEKSKSLQQQKEHLDSEHKHELESLRHRFKLAISTTSIERTPSETSLEKVNLDLVDQLAQEREVTKLKQLITDEKNRYEDLLVKIKREKDEEVKAIRSAIQAERQVSFNEALNRLSNERDLLAQELKAKQQSLQTTISAINDIMCDHKGLESERDTPQPNLTKQAFERIETLLNSLNTECEHHLSDSVVCDRRPQCVCDSANLIKEKDLEINRLNRLLRDNEMSQSSTAIGRIERVSVLGCEVGDIVIVYYEQKFDNYIIFSLNNVHHFLHMDCLEALSLKQGSGEARQRWTIAEVTDKEYCQARKAQNRYNVALNTKFYRVKAKPWSRLMSLPNTRSIFSPTLPRTEPSVESSSAMSASHMSGSVATLESRNLSSNDFN